MGDHSIGRKILEERLHQTGVYRSLEPNHIMNQKHGVVREAYELFLTHFGPSSTDFLKAAVAPGRVNLIGDHIDYCDGFVLPMAIPLYTVVIGRPAVDQLRGSTNVFSSNFTEPITIFQPYSQKKEEDVRWGRYIQGVLALTECNLCFDLVVHSTIPVGIPLPDGIKSAQLCQRVEHEFAGVPCGIMDQFVITFAEYAHALKIDCRSLTFDLIPLSISHDALFLIVDSGAHHNHASGEYAKRRKMVEEALRVFNVASWRDVTYQLVQEKSPLLDDLTLDCAYHVVDEIERTLKASEALLDNDITRFGRFMCESHHSLKEKFRVSCPEIDELVSLILSCDGVFGSRMTGGGFGGCTVSLVRKDNVDNVKNHIRDNYRGGIASFYECEPVSHACAVQLDFLSIV
ncbi:galactokinase [Dictyocaulus viviparus]|uniref:Galactokinase n=1 Tax=Dictyocaulus viviparus TaxID=29172 RepID=A0A0D8Y1C2_DICVI|nr:galactokinase [Dictyocaulus viviparus]